MGSQLTSSALGATVATAWPSNTAAGNLLIATVHFRTGNATQATVTCSTVGWSKAVSAFQNTVGSQTEIWYKANSAAADSSPTFVITASKAYEVAVAEVTGVATTSPLDKTGTASISTTANIALSVATSATIANGSEFVYAALGISNSANSAITWGSITAAGSATLGATIDALGAASGTTNEALAHAWATSGSAGTSPSVTGNATNGTARAAFALATFIAAAGGGGTPTNTGQFFALF